MHEECDGFHWKANTLVEDFMLHFSKNEKKKKTFRIYNLKLKDRSVGLCIFGRKE